VNGELMSTPDQVRGGLLAAAADALDLGIQQLVAFGRRRLDVVVIGSAAIGCEKFAVHASMPAVAAVKTAAEAVSATRFGRRREAERQAQRERASHRSITCHTCHIGLSGFITSPKIAPLKAESRQSDFTISRLFERETPLILRKVGQSRNV
jgi:hypothetical protein